MADISLGQVAYEAYWQAMYRSRPLSFGGWAVLDPVQRGAWEAAATAGVEERRRRNVVITACQDPGCGDGCHG